MCKEIITLRYEVHDGDVTDQFLWPLAKTSLTEVLLIDFEHGKWVVTHPEENIPEWVGRHEYKQQAILNYLKNRLGMHEVDGSR